MTTYDVKIDGIEFQFTPSHDERGVAVPEYWEHEFSAERFYSEDECINWIKQLN